MPVDDLLTGIEGIDAGEKTVPTPAEGPSTGTEEGFLPVVVLATGKERSVLPVEA